METSDRGGDEGAGGTEGTLQPHQCPDGRIPPEGIQDARHNMPRMWGKYLNDIVRFEGFYLVPTSAMFDDIKTS